MSRSAAVKQDVITSITTFGDLLRYLRQRQQMTQRDLALAVGYSISQISRLEHNERLPDELTLLAVFVPALGLEQESATVDRLLFLARQARRSDVASPNRPEPSRETVRPDPVAPPTAPRLTNLPHRLTSFVGREQEVAALQRLVQEQRLVTLTGVGGVGKSSLALAVAEMLTFPDGVWLLELAPLTEGGLVARALMDLFKLPEFPGRTSLEAVTAYLQHKALLLIVDNCEHLIATCADLVERLLQAAPRLHVVTTSREALNIAGEREWPVSPLPTPSLTATVETTWSLARLQPFAAAQLFIERVQAMKAASPFTDQDAPLIAHLCQQLDGLPLALELAAARCKSLTLPELVTRLQDRFALLSAGRRTALLRHQTLRATLDWSYDLLSPAEAALFRALAVFVDGWTLAAAELVADPDQKQPSMFHLLHQLVNKSLVSARPRGATTRYQMLETIRQYAEEKLQEHGEAETVRARHFAWCLTLAQKAAPIPLLRAPLEQWCNEVKADLDNVRAALVWSYRQADRGESCLRLITALGPFWQLSKNFDEGSLWLERALAQADRADTALTSWAVVWLAFTLFYASPRSFALASEALERFTPLNQPDGMALANLLLGIWAVARGDTNKALACLQQAVLQFEKRQAIYLLSWAYLHLADALALAGERTQALHTYRLAYQLEADADGYPVFRWVWESMAQLDAPQVVALCQQQLVRQRQGQNQVKVAALLQTLGRVYAVAGELPSALATLTEGLALWLKLGGQPSQRRGPSQIYLDLALVQYLCQEHQAAMVSAQQAIQLYQEAGDLYHTAYAYVGLGYPALAVADLTLARNSFQQGIQMVAQQEINCTYLALLGLAEVARRQQQLTLAAFLFGVTERFHQRPKPLLDRWKEAFFRSLFTAAQAQLCDSAYAAAWAEGQAMPFDQAMQLALTL